LLAAAAVPGTKEPVQPAGAGLGDALGCRLLWPAWSVGPAKETPSSPAACLAHGWEGAGIAWLILFSGPLQHTQGTLPAIYFATAPSGIKYSCLSNGNRRGQLSRSHLQPATR